MHQGGMIWLSLGFALVALLYSSVGFGGGSTYTALLVLSGVPVLVVPIVSLCCNILVSGLGTVKCWRAGLYANSRGFPILALSVPAAFLGGLTPIPERTLILLLGGALLAAGVQLAWASLRHTSSSEMPNALRLPVLTAPLLGAGIGYVSGVVGIGGGIFLAPVLHLVRWAPPRTVAALSSAYIATNSVAALIGKSLSVPTQTAPIELWKFWPLLIAVAVGSWAGHKLLLGMFPERWVKAVTALLVLVVAFRLLTSHV
jgi:uncharacterized protein